MQQPFATPSVGTTALRDTGAAVRTAQTIGLEWLDLGKQSYEDVVATAGRMAACRSPGEALALQGDLVQRMTGRALARSVVLSDQFTALFGHLLRPAGPRRLP